MEELSLAKEIHRTVLQNQNRKFVAPCCKTRKENSNPLSPRASSLEISKTQEHDISCHAEDLRPIGTHITT
jgi:hypothetical protein